jgi:hypothetical protein
MKKKEITLTSAKGTRRSLTLKTERLNHKETMAPPQIWDWVWETLAEVSDEIGIEKKGGYLLAYEGWGGFCVSKVFDPRKSEEENEERYYQYAEEQSDEVIEEWIEAHKQTHQLIDSGYEPTGLYGVTWALFKKSKNTGCLLKAIDTS